MTHTYASPRLAISSHCGKVRLARLSALHERHWREPCCLHFRVSGCYLVFCGRIYATTIFFLAEPSSTRRKVSLTHFIILKCYAEYYLAPCMIVLFPDVIISGANMTRIWRDTKILSSNLNRKKIEIKIFKENVVEQYRSSRLGVKINNTTVL